VKEVKRYQEEAISKLLRRTKDYIEENGNETIVFQAPTGSGKTFMITKYMEQLISEVKDELCFVWISVGKGELHKQSYKSVKENIKSDIEVSLMEEEFFGFRREINQNEIVFLNWEKIRTRDRNTGDWKNIYMRDIEKNNFIEVLENTRAVDRKIILIIDESHASATSDRAIEIRDEIIKADLTIEMSATPIIQNSDSKVMVDSVRVIEEGMIKKEILINDGIDLIEDNELNSQELIMKLAIDKMKELKGL
jgi:type III restriction enzyme